MSRRNTRQGKARRRAHRDRGPVAERARNRPGTPDQGPRAVEDQAAPRPEGSGPRNSDEHGSGLHSAAGGGLIAVDPGEADVGSDADLENADPDDFGDLDPDDADLQAVLAEEDLAEEDLGEADLQAVLAEEDLGEELLDLFGREVLDGDGLEEVL